MQEREFNLLEEPWVKVVTASLEQKEVSLTDALVYAHEYMGLSGEMPTQDAALLRVLLAIGITIFYRYDADGRQDELSEGCGIPLCPSSHTAKNSQNLSGHQESFMYLPVFTYYNTLTPTLHYLESWGIHFPLPFFPMGSYNDKH